jgi:RNA polymerase sigma-70 factor (ECF subfamily)
VQTPTLAPAHSFGELEQYRGELTAYCYRMLGSPFDAEDAVQDAFVRAWRNREKFEGRSAMRSWLYRIATNVCLDMLKGKERRARPMDLGPSCEPIEANLHVRQEATWLEPIPLTLVAPDRDPADVAVANESIRLAFVAALQHLPARQRAVLILREVLGFSAQEVAETLDSTVASVNSALQRARKAIDEELPDQSQQATLRALGDKRVQDMIETYMRAWEDGDIDTIVGMLTEDVTMAMPPMPTWFRGLEASTGFLTNFVFADRDRRQELISFAGERRRARLLPASASGQPAFGVYHWNDEAGAYMPIALQVLTLRGDRIRDVTAFVNPAALPRFGLPERIGEDA